MSVPSATAVAKPTATSQPVATFLRHHFRHFNAAALVDAADAYRKHIEGGGRMMIALAGAMSTAELGVSLAAMIRAGKIHAISCTGANLEEDLFNYVAHDHYERIPHYRDLTPADEAALLARHMNRVTDTCIPEAEAMRRIESAVLEEWLAAERKGESALPHEFLYRAIRKGTLKPSPDVDPQDSWLIAAMEKKIPLFVPGWEDSTLGNMYASHCIDGSIKDSRTVVGGIGYMLSLARWYMDESKKASIGLFQIGGGIAGDFPICVVPMLHQDLQMPDIPVWGYFAQISDSTTSYGSYSGAVPNEKITWGKLAVDTPRFIVESDASIVAPLVFAIVMGW